MSELGFEVVHIGDTVRSLDFPSDPSKNDTHYVECEIVDIVNRECPRYKILVAKKVFRGMVMSMEDDEPLYVYPPVNGTPTLIEGVVTNGVHKLPLEQTNALPA